MNTTTDKSLPVLQFRIGAVEIPRHVIIVSGCWIAIVTGLIATSETALISPAHGLLALYCFCVILLRPFDESPFALLLLAMGPSDNFIFFGALLFFLRAMLSGKLYIDNKISSILFLFFITLVLCSTAISYLTVGFRPLQTVFWGITFLIPLTLAVVKYKYRIDGYAIAKYSIILIAMQIIPVIAAIPSYLEKGSPDVFGGTWMDADILGFWGTALAMSAGILSLMHRWSQSERRSLLLLATVGGVLAVAASGKIYSVFIVGLGWCFLVVSAEFVQGLLRGKIKAVLFLLAGGLGVVFIISTLASQLGAIKAWSEYQYEYSHKIIFLDRVFNQMETYGYSNLFGVGPGMLGSRAANAVSSDVLHKEEIHLPQVLQGAPQPEARIMSELFDKEFQDRVRYMSANMVIPFSGIGAMKGELGWLGLITVVFVFFSLFWPSRINTQLMTSNYQAAVIYFMVSISGLSTIFLSIFDTVWEQPKVMIILAMLVLAAKSFSSRIENSRVENALG